MTLTGLCAYPSLSVACLLAAGAMMTAASSASAAAPSASASASAPVAAKAASAFPSRPVRLLLGSAAGGAADVLMRTLTQEMTLQLGQQVVVDNRPGGSGLIAMELLARAEPDGYTIGYGNAATLAINPALFDRLPYDSLRDFQPIARFNSSQNVLVVRTTLPVASVTELVEYARRNPGKLSYGSPGNGTTVHLAAELFLQMTGTRMLHVPYKAIGQATSEMIGGQIDVMFDNLTSIAQHVKSGKVRALGVTGPARTPLFPELPTIAEAGVPKYEVTTWGGVIGPARLPPAVLARLNESIVKGCETPALKERLSAVGNQCVGGTPQGFRDFLRVEIAKWAEIVKQSGVKPE